MLTNYPSYQPPDEYSTPSPIHFQLQSTYARALERHRNQLNRDIVPCLCQVFLLRHLLAGVITKHLQEKQTPVKQRHSRGKTPPAKISHMKTGIVPNPAKYQSVEPSRQWQAEKTTSTRFYKCQKQSSEFSVSCSIA